MKILNLLKHLCGTIFILTLILVTTAKADVSIDQTFNAKAGFLPRDNDKTREDPLNALTIVLDDNSLVECTNFTAYQGKEIHGMVHISSTGNYLPTYKKTSFMLRKSRSYPLYCSKLRDGKIFAAGSFTKVNKKNRTQVAIINTDGTLHPFSVSKKGFSTFAADNASAEVFGAIEQADGTLIVWGDFSFVNGSQVVFPGIAHLSAAGELLNDFPSGLDNIECFSSTVSQVLEVSDGYFLFGDFIQRSPTTVTSALIKLDLTGNLVTDFSTIADGVPDGLSLIERRNFAFVAEDGSIYAADNSSIQKYSALGVYDPSFAPVFPERAYPTSVVQLSDGTFLSMGFIGTKAKLYHISADGLTVTEPATFPRSVYYTTLTTDSEGRAIISGNLSLRLNGKTANSVVRLTQ